MSEPTKFILFKRQHKTKEMSGYITFGWGGLFGAAEPKEPWQEQTEVATETAKETKECLEFVAIVTSPKEVAKIVRKEPLAKFVLFSGTIAQVEVAMPVFIGGKAADTMDKEWS